MGAAFVIDPLLVLLSNEGFDVQAYVDNLKITVCGKNDKVVSDFIQKALNIIWAWCQETGLSINPKKTVLVPFTKRTCLRRGGQIS